MRLAGFSTHLVDDNLLEVGDTLLLEGGQHGGKVGKAVHPQVHPGLLLGLEAGHQHLWGDILFHSAPNYRNKYAQGALYAIASNYSSTT